MKSTFDILSATKQVLNPVLASAIDGKVLLRQSAATDKKANVVLGVINNPGNYVQSGIMNINPECMGVDDDIPNMKKLKTIVDLIFPLVDDKVHVVNGVTLHLTIDDDKGIFKDERIKGKFFYNIRVNFITL